MYIFECSDSSYYTGSTKDLKIRLEQHQNGDGAIHTAKRLPVILLYYEEFQRIDEAFYREKQVQGWSRKKKEALIENNFSDLEKFSECQNESHHKNGFGSAQPPRDEREELGFGSGQPTV
ncbi:MAG: GIY-YIG nuclease family protein [Lutibacter sp.]|nr:GIY-YIG nuclease family protein [Lutibacter sp.]